MKWSWLARCAAVALLAGCTAPSASPPAASTAPPAQSTAKFGPQFQALLDKAKAGGGGQIRAGITAYTPEYIRALEKQFNDTFGIPITLENEPGHGSREIPPKMMQAQKAGKGLIDYIEGGNASNFAPLMQQDALQIPPWDALTEQWPMIAELRKMYPNVTGGPNNTTLQDYCMLNTQTPWTFIYNTRNVKPEEVKDLKWDDLLSDKWNGRIAWDAQGLGFKELPFHSEWPVDRLKAYTNNLGANRVKMISGGTNAVIQAVIQGEGDIGMAATETVLDQISSGAPIGMVWPGIVPFNSLGTCMPKITANNEALAQIFFAWHNIDGEYLRAEMGSGGARPFYPPEADRFPLAKLAKEANINDARLAQPKDPSDFERVEEYRSMAIEGMKAGLASGQKVPYPPR